MSPYTKPTLGFKGVGQVLLLLVDNHYAAVDGSTLGNYLSFGNRFDGIMVKVNRQSFHQCWLGHAHLCWHHVFDIDFSSGSRGRSTAETSFTFACL